MYGKPAPLLTPRSPPSPSGQEYHTSRQQRLASPTRIHLRKTNVEHVVFGCSIPRYLFHGDNGGVHVLLLDVSGNPASERKTRDNAAKEEVGGAEGGLESTYGKPRRTTCRRSITSPAPITGYTSARSPERSLGPFPKGSTRCHSTRCRRAKAN